MGPCSITGVAALNLRGFGSGKQGGRRERGGKRERKGQRRCRKDTWGGRQVGGIHEVPSTIILSLWFKVCSFQMNYESKGVFVFHTVLFYIIPYFTFLHGETQDSVIFKMSVSIISFSPQGTSNQHNQNSTKHREFRHREELKYE